MTQAMHFLGFWAAAFVTLCAAVALLSLFFRLTDSDLGLQGWGKEAAVAFFASFFEGAGLWFVMTLFPAATRVLFIPALIVYFIYRLDHLTDWSGHEPVMILIFQAIIGWCVVLLLRGEFGLALMVAVLFFAALAIVGSLVKNLV